VEFKAYETSSAQRRLFLVNHLQGDSILYNIPTAKIIDGNLAPGRLEEAIKKLLQRHEAMRTCFAMKQGNVLQKVYSRIDWELPVKEFPQREIEKVIIDFIRPFDLQKIPLWRMELMRMNTNRFLLLFDIHHIIADGISIEIIFKEIMVFYFGKELPPLEFQYIDFTIWQNDIFRSGQIKSQEEYWLKTFAGEIPLLNIPTDYPRPAEFDIPGAVLEFEISPELTSKLNALAAACHTTLFGVLLTAFNLLLAKYSTQEHIVIGTPIAGRPHPELEMIVGMFVNTLALRNDPLPGKTVAAFLDEVSANAFAAFENQDYPFEMLVEKLKVDRHLNRNPLFDAMFALQNYYKEVRLYEEEENKLEFSDFPISENTAKFDLTLFAFEIRQHILFKLEYRTSLYRQESIEQMAKHFIRILNIIPDNLDVGIGDIQILTAEDKERLLNEFNDTTTQYPREKTIHQLFEDQVKQTPDSIALEFGNKQLTYKVCNEAANRLSISLRDRGVKPGAVVAILDKSSLERIIAVIGIMKAGAAYLPIDTKQPRNRITSILDDCRVSLVLTRTPELYSFYEEKERTILAIEPLINQTNHNGALVPAIVENPGSGAVSNDLLYIITTSGSTGKPKYVMLEHRNLVNLLYHEYTTALIDFSNRVLQYASIGFDVAAQEIFSTLLAGGHLFLIPGETKTDILGLLVFIESRDIDILFLPPAFLKFVFSQSDYTAAFPDCVRHIIAAGEQLTVPDSFRDYLVKNRVYLHNHYGPTETHVVSTLTLEPGGEIPKIPSIGKPISNTKIYIVDSSSKLLPIGIPGELIIAGDSVGRGYYNRDDLTKACFIPHPFQEGALVYKTGDLARWRFDGNIQFLGRIDQQVKIRGFRIEPGEIETLLVNHCSVKAAVVIAREEENGDKYLCAYIVTHCAGDLSQELKEFLSRELPHYMMPAYFVRVTEIPLSSSGKVDLKQLPEPRSTRRQAHTPYRNRVEKKLVGIWQEVLRGQSSFGIDDNFFEFGGHSLKATLLIARIHQEFDVMVPLKEVFKRPTIRGLAAYIKQSAATQFTAREAVEEKQYYAVSSVQKRLYFLQTLEPQNMSYNIVDTVLIEGELDIHRVKQDFKKIIQRHDSLRTSFFLVNGEPFQRVHQDIDFHLSLTEAGDNQVNEMFEHFVAPFDLEQAPLLRVQLVKTGSRKHYLMMDMHHIISDGTSLAIFITDFMALYEGRQLPDLPLQYKDYSEWQNSQEQKEAIMKQEAFWLKHFEGEIPLLNLPTTYTRPPEKNFKGSTYSIKLDTDNLDTIKRIAAQGEATPFMVLLAIFNILLYKLSGQEDIVVGTSTVGRRHVDLNHIIGMFVNAVALRNFPRGSRTFPEFLADVKERTLSAFENQDYLFENLVEQLNIKREHGRSPVFDVMFVMNNEDIPEINITGLTLKPLSFDSNTSQFDLKFRAIEAPQHLLLVMEYSTQLFTRDVIKGYMENFQEILTSLGENIDVTLENIPISHGLVSSKSNILKNDQGDFEF